MILPCQTRVKISSSLATALRHLNQRHQFEGAAAEPHRPAVAKIVAKRPNFTIAGRGRRGELQAMTVINISKKITGFRRKTSELDHTNPN
jgi:hypothetical protein